MDLLSVPTEEREFLTVHFLPAIRSVAMVKVKLFSMEGTPPLDITLVSTTGCSLALICWPAVPNSFMPSSGRSGRDHTNHDPVMDGLQEDVIDLGEANLSPEANALGAQFLPVLNQ